MEFDSVNTAYNVFRALQGTNLDGHELDLQLSRPKKYNRALKKVQNVRSCTKLIVKNLPFQATKEELRQLFSPFGQVSACFLHNRNIW